MGLTALVIAGAVVGIAVGTVGTIGSAVQAQQQKNMAKFNQRMAERNAAQENINAAAAQARANAAAEAEAAEYARKEQLEREKNAKLRGYNLAAQGYSGMASDQGSSLLVNIDNAVNAELSALDIRRIGQNEAANIRYEGELNAFQHRLNTTQYLGEAANYEMQKKAISSQQGWQLAGDIIGTVGKGIQGAAAGASLGAGLAGGAASSAGSFSAGSTLLNQNLPKMQVTGTTKWGSMA